MFMNRLLKLAAAMSFALSVAGCGSGNSNTNGTLTLTPTVTPQSLGTVLLKATATLTPAKVGSSISFSADQYYTDTLGVIQHVVNPIPTASLSTDLQGIAEWPYVFKQQAVESTLLVTASSGGLFRTGTVIIPKL